MPALQSISSTTLAFALAFAAIPTPVSAQDEPHTITVTVNAKKTFQTIEGFGTCLINWGQYPAETYTSSFADFYARTVGLNMLRENISFYLHPEVDDPSEISWKKIYYDDQTDYEVFPDFSAKLMKINPDTRIIGTVWSPPSWMKVNKDIGNGTYDTTRVNRAIRASAYITKIGPSDNRVDPAKYDHFVQWLVAVAQYHEKKGIPFYGLSLSNEPRFSQWYNSCVWTAEDYAEVLGRLGIALEKAELDHIHLFGPEDMTGHMHPEGTEMMIAKIIENPKALEALDRFATHGYTDGVQMDTTEDSSRVFWEYIEDTGKPYWMTEGGTGGHEWPTPILDGLGMAIHNSLVAGHASAFVPWQISEPKPSTHAIAVDDTITPKTAAGMHYFRNVPIDGQRIDASPAFGKVQASAYRHSETGKTAIVLINATDQAQEIEIELRGFKGGVPEAFQLHRTSANERFTDCGSVDTQQGAIRIHLPGTSMASLASQ